MILHLTKENETPRALLGDLKNSRKKWDLIQVVYEKHTATFKGTICEKTRGKKPVATRLELIIPHCGGTDCQLD